jgi:hypothetical protein
MTYVLFPNSSQSLGQTQAGIKNNFSLIQTTIDQNHIDLNLAGKGKHTVIQMPVLGSIPVNPVPPGGLVAGDATLYSKTTNATSNFFFSPDASGNEYQLTRGITASFANFGAATKGWTFLPGGLLLQYGLQNAIHSVPIVFPIPFTNPPFNIQITASIPGQTRSTVYADTSSITNTQFSAWTLDSSGNSTSTGISWIAIGI